MTIPDIAVCAAFVTIVLYLTTDLWWSALARPETAITTKPTSFRDMLRAELERQGLIDESFLQ